MRPILINVVEPLPIEFLGHDVSPKGQIMNEDLDVCMESKVIEGRRAAEAHRRSRYKLLSEIKVGMSLNEIVNIVESSTRILLAGERNNGLGFPTGVSLNDCAAHFSTNPGENEIYLKTSDVLKVDFGTHVNGRIMDSAFTICFDPAYEELLKASQEGTEMGIKHLNVDTKLSEIGRAIEEVICSYEIVIDGNTIPIIPVHNLNGHSIDQYTIHGGISIPIVRNSDSRRIKANSFYALETFASTGKGYVDIKNLPCSHYMLDRSVKKSVSNPKNKKVLSCIINQIGTLPFCPRYVDELMNLSPGSESKPSIDILSGLGILEPYPPLIDSKGSLVSQFEHTIYLGEKTKEVLTRGDDY